MTQGSDSKPLIERRSIDYIPANERHGRLYSQFTLWLGPTCRSPPSSPAPSPWSSAATCSGRWSACSSASPRRRGDGPARRAGPRLGLPQMISSRVQFGVYGACIPIALVCLMYLGFTATGTVLSGQAIGQLTGLSDSAGIFIFAAFIVLVTVLGYRVIHIIGRIASVLGIIAFAYLFSRLMLLSDIGDPLAIRHFSWASFLLAVSLAASWQIAFGPYVADYSRYLPASTSSWKTFLAVSLGSVLGAQASMVLGCSPQPWPTPVRRPRGGLHRRPGQQRDRRRAALLQHRLRQGDHFHAELLRQLHVHRDHHQQRTRSTGDHPRATPVLRPRDRRRLDAHRAARPALVPRCVQVLHPVPADLLHPVERGEPGRLLLHHPRAL